MIYNFMIFIFAVRTSPGAFTTTAVAVRILPQINCILTKSTIYANKKFKKFFIF